MRWLMSPSSQHSETILHKPKRSGHRSDNPCSILYIDYIDRGFNAYSRSRHDRVGRLVVSSSGGEVTG
jgi:hypothetical protein